MSDVPKLIRWNNRPRALDTLHTVINDTNVNSVKFRVRQDNSGLKIFYALNWSSLREVW